MKKGYLVFFVLLLATQALATPEESCYSILSAKANETYSATLPIYADFTLNAKHLGDISKEVLWIDLGSSTSWGVKDPVSGAITDAKDNLVLLWRINGKFDSCTFYHLVPRGGYTLTTLDRQLAGSDNDTNFSRFDTKADDFKYSGETFVKEISDNRNMPMLAYEAVQLNYVGRESEEYSFEIPFADLMDSRRSRESMDCYSALQTAAPSYFSASIPWTFEEFIANAGEYRSHQNMGATADRRPRFRDVMLDFGKQTSWVVPNPMMADPYPPMKEYAVILYYNATLLEGCGLVHFVPLGKYTISTLDSNKSNMLAGVQRARNVGLVDIHSGNNTYSGLRTSFDYMDNDLNDLVRYDMLLLTFEGSSYYSEHQALEKVWVSLENNTQQTGWSGGEKTADYVMAIKAEGRKEISLIAKLLAFLLILGSLLFMFIGSRQPRREQVEENLNKARVCIAQKDFARAAVHYRTARAGFDRMRKEFTDSETRTLAQEFTHIYEKIKAK